MSGRASLLLRNDVDRVPVHQHRAALDAHISAGVDDNAHDLFILLSSPPLSFSLFLSLFFLYMVAPCAPNEKCYKLTTRANDLFERHLYAEALIEYTKALKCATETGSCDDDYLALIYANRSATCLLVGDCQQAKEDAARAIALAKRWGKVIDSK